MAAVQRYHRFQRAQKHEHRGDLHLALRAYEGAGAMKCAHLVRVKLGLDLTSQLPHAA
jgi:hypothetical protein